MDLAVAIKNTDDLSLEEKNEIEIHINHMIETHKNNRYEINRLVFESVSALTESENYSDELSSKKGFKRFWAGITGKNRELRDNIDRSLVKSQYASQQTLQKLAEQNLMSFELITSINNKLNASILDVENEINNIYGTLVTFFKQTKSDIIQLENRVDRLEKNVNLLNWQNSIEYQMFDGVEYNELSKIEKIVCILRDFYDLTKGNWTTSDLLLLKTAMGTIGLSPKDTIDYKSFILDVCSNPKLYLKLIPEDLLNVKVEPRYITVFSGINKVKKFNGKEKYILDNTMSVLMKHGVSLSEDDIKAELLDAYERSEANIDISKEINLYEFILEVLYNLDQAKVSKYIQTLPEKMKYAEKMFMSYKIKEVIPILEELSDYGFTRAKYLLSLIYEEGYLGIEKNPKLRQELVCEAFEMGDAVAAINLALFVINDKEESNRLYVKYIAKLEELSDLGDVFATYELGRVSINLFNKDWAPENDYDKAVKCFQICADSGFFRAYFSMGHRYYYGQGVEKDLSTAFQFFQKAADMGYVHSLYEVACHYEDGWGIEQNYTKAFEYFEKASYQGHYDSLAKMGYFYSDGLGVETDDSKAFECFLKAANNDIVWAMGNVGWSYEYGKGVTQDYNQAIKYYQKASEMGNPYSTCNLGFIYLNGKGVQVDKNIARKYFEKAAEDKYEIAITALKDNF